jgi:cytidylate kinase
MSLVPKVPVIAIDGPTASGKGTIAAGVAARLGFNYLDSGSLYRLVSLKARAAGVRLDDEQTLAAIAGSLRPQFGDGRIRLDGEDVTDLIREESVGAAASAWRCWARCGARWWQSSGASGSRRGWSQTAATWGRQSFRRRS